MRQSVSYSDTHTIVSKVFQNAREQHNNQLIKIHDSQKRITGSPNFFYKGDTWILVKRYPMYVLDTSIMPEMGKYLRQLDRLSNKITKLTFLLNNFKINNSTSDLYYVLPKEAHQFLPNSDSFIIRSQEHVDNIIHEFDEEILTIIQEQLLHNLLL